MNPIKSNPSNILNIRMLEACFARVEEYDKAIEMQKRINHLDQQSCQALDVGYANKDYSQAMLALARSKENLANSNLYNLSG